MFPIFWPNYDISDSQRQPEIVSFLFQKSGGEIHTVFDEESESAVRIDEFLHPEEKIKKNQN